jgi:hypothetical protein
MCAMSSAPAARAGVAISHQWLRYVAPSVPAAGYFRLRNNSDKAVLFDGAESSACGKLALHESVVQNGTVRMEVVQAISVPPGGAVSFQPGAYHLMCMSPTHAVRPGQTVTVTLQFQDHSSLNSDFPVYAAKGK